MMTPTPRMTLPLFAPFAPFALFALCATPALAQEDMARVLSSTAVMQQVAVPRQVCTTQQVIQQGQPSGAGAAMGAIAGGAVGNAIGDGSGRAIATMIGLVGGAVLGNRIEGTRDEVRNVQQCTTQTSYENRVLHYDVIYEYDNKRYSIKMPNDPGAYVRLQMNPVGAMPPPAVAPTTTIINRPMSVVPAPAETTITYVQNEPIYVVPAPVHVHPGYVAGPWTVYPAVRGVWGPQVSISVQRGGHHGRPHRWH
jgi:uncharacterized protein YcfJ